MGRGRGAVAGSSALLVVAVMAAAIGCGSDEPDAKPSADRAPATSAPSTTPAATATPATTATPPRWPAVARRDLDVVGAACPAPQDPVHVQRSRYPDPTATTEGTAPPPTGALFDGSSIPTDPALDVLVRRWSSEPDTGGVGGGYGPYWIGDLDGDGADETALLRTEPSATTGGSRTPVVVVPAGGDAPTDGIALPVDASQGERALGVGDLDGDGADDLLVLAREGVVVSGRDVVSGGPGSALTQLPPPLAVLDVRPVGILQLVAETGPVLVHLDGDRLVLGTDPELALRLAPDTIGTGSGTAQVGAYRSGGHRIVVLGTDDGRSGGRQVQMWDLDAPCPGVTGAASSGRRAPGTRERRPREGAS